MKSGNINIFDLFKVADLLITLLYILRTHILGTCCCTVYTGKTNFLYIDKAAFVVYFEFDSKLM